MYSSNISHSTLWPRFVRLGNQTSAPLETRKVPSRPPPLFTVKSTSVLPSSRMGGLKITSCAMGLLPTLKSPVADGTIDHTDPAGGNQHKTARGPPRAAREAPAPGR